MKPALDFQPAHARVAGCAQNAPTAAAVLRGDGVSMNYAALAARAQEVAGLLDRVGAAPNVGVFLESGSEAVAALLGVLASGRTVAPLDPSYPSDRIAWMLEDTKADHVLTSRGLAERVPGDSVRALCLDESMESGAVLDASPSGPGDPACILYTSGSAGRPKGVVRSHRGIVARLDWLRCAPDDIFCHNMSLNVGFSQERLFIPLMLGLPLAVISSDVYSSPRRFVASLKAHGVTQLTLTPHTLGQILDLGSDIAEPLRRLRTVVSGGATVQPELVTRFRALLPHVSLVNAYGSTESGTIIRGEITAGESPVPLGRPVSGTIVHILDADMQPCPPGEAGEIVADGPCVASGYLNDAELTRERFVPSLSDPGRLMYRTGDRGRYLPDGRIEFLGRLDRQVKVRGFRVELGEVEAALRNDPRVGEGVVKASGSAGDVRLAAYVVPSPGTVRSSESLRNRLRERLPEHMVPTVVSFLDELPRTLAGKVDMTALPAPELAARSGSDYRAPDGRIESSLAEIWTAHLGVERIGADDEFAALGGDSLDQMQMLANVERLFDLELAADRLPSPLTVSSLAVVLEAMSGGQEDRVSIAPREAGSPPPLSFLQEARLFAETTAELSGRPYDQGRSGMVLEIEGRLDIGILEQAIREIVRRHESLRTTFAIEVFLGGMRLSGVMRLDDHLRNSPLRPTVRIRHIVHENAVPLFEHIDLTHLADDEVNQEAARLLDTAIHSEFDYEKAPLMKAAVVTRAPDRHTLMVAISHLVCDGWSLEIFHRELCALYEAFDCGAEARLPELSLHFADFAAWQRQAMQGKTLEKLLTYWTGQYEHIRPLGLADLAVARKPSGPPDLGAEQQLLELEPELAASLGSMARERRVTLFALMFAGFGVLLRAYTGRETFGVMTFTANRPSSKLEHVIGWLASGHMISLAIEESMTFGDLIKHARDQIMESQIHQGLPSPLLYRHLGRGGSRMQSPPITLEMRRYTKIPSPPGLRITRTPLIPRSEMEGGLRVWVMEPSPESIALRAVYRRAWLERSAITRLLADFRSVLVKAVEDPSLPVSTLMPASPGSSI